MAKNPTWRHTTPQNGKIPNTEVQHPEISLVQNDPPLFFKQILLIIGKKPYLTTNQGGGCKNGRIQQTVVQHPEISIFCGCNRFFFNSEGGVLKK